MVATERLNTQEKVEELEKVRHEPLHQVDIPFEKATFGMGCFWGCDSLFGATRGVL